MVLLLSAVQGLNADNVQKESPLRAEKSGLPATWVVLDRPSAKVRARYPYGVTFLKDTDSDTLIGNVDTDIVPIIFKRDKTDVIFPNEPLDSIVSVLNRVIHDPEVNLRYVWIAGSASPEGPEKHNEWLGKTRAKRLYDYLIAHTSLPDSLIHVENLKEDWRTPLRLIENDEFDHKDKVIEIWRSEATNAQRKKQIQAIDNGVTWEYLIDKPFRPTRNARMVIVCNAKDTVAFYPVDLENLFVWPLVPPIMPELAMEITQIQPAMRGQFVALKTNLGALGLLVANLGVEFSFGNGFSLDLPFYYSPYDITDKFRVRILGTQPELRYWLNHDWPGEGHFFGLNGTVAGFDVSFPGNWRRFQDPEHALWGVGVSYGYALNFGHSKAWGLEFNIGIGYMNYKYDTFRNEYNGKLLKTSPTQNYWGITRLGINLTYKFWRTSEKKRKGVKL
ncbi:MAG: DUF3575 domain-containing protein [Muribaculaceae bacterium]|nr:DUF3575 domain-containing protein [Muribaculaceae bacterium]